jgi:copper transport protein
MPRTRALAQVVVVLVVAVAAVFALPGAAAAHNSVVSSDPASGSVLTVAPTQMVMTFLEAVPRSALTPVTHGPRGDVELIAPLPPLPNGETTVRWRLVGADGHVLSERTVFTVAVPVVPAATVSSPTATPAPTPASPSSAPSVAPRARATVDAQPYSVPAAARWLLRYAAYLAIVALVGIVLTDLFVWPGSADRPAALRVLSIAVVAIVVTGALQFAALASDVGGHGWPSPGDLEGAGRTAAGTALVIRLVLAACAWLLLRRPTFTHPDVRWSALGLTGASLLATWAFAGHSASQRWPHLGVPVDVVHHVAAALWIGALAIVGTGAVPPGELAAIFGRLSRRAAAAVWLIVLTGVAQAIRLVGDPTRLLAAAHGRYLVAKLAALAVMLTVADLNRRRVAVELARPQPRASSMHQLRRSVLLELGLGLVVIGITAALVVARPATAT